MPDLRGPLLLVATIAFAGIGALIAHGPIAQDQCYHAFADQRPWLGIPNASDVLSNLAFALAAALAWPALRRARWADPRDRLPWIVYAGSLLLTALGSAYYHWAPADDRLFWDRLPLSLTLAALAAASLGERLTPARRPWMLGGFLLAAGLATGWWRFSGDLRPYAVAQFLPLVLVATLAVATPGRYDRHRDPLVAALFYIVAKIGETYDARILEALGGAVSGHTLKHFAAALGGWWLVRMLALRAPTSLLALRAPTSLLALRAPAAGGLSAGSDPAGRA